MFILLKLLYSFFLLFPLSEVVFYPGIIEQRLKIPLLNIMFFGFFIFLIIRFFSEKKHWQSIGIFGLYKLTPIITVLALILRGIEIFTYPNFVYSYFHVDPVQVGVLASYTALISLPLIDAPWVKKNYKITIIVFSLLSYHLLLIYWINYDFFYLINSEDHIIEYLTSLVFALSAIIAFLSLKSVKNLPFLKWQKNMLLLFLILFGLAMFFVAGEEISWGQRILKIETPESISHYNTQQELNIHNHVKIFPYVYKLYFAVSLYGLISWKFWEILKSKLCGFPKFLLRLATTYWYLFLLFLPSFTYATLRCFVLGNIFIDQWEETTELQLAIGIFLTIYINTYNLRQKNLKTKTL